MALESPSDVDRDASSNVAAFVVHVAALAADAHELRFASHALASLPRRNEARLPSALRCIAFDASLATFDATHRRSSVVALFAVRLVPSQPADDDDDDQHSDTHNNELDVALLRSGLTRTSVLERGDASQFAALVDDASGDAECWRFARLVVDVGASAELCFDVDSLLPSR